MIFLANVEVGNRFRAAFIDHDHEDYRESLEKSYRSELATLERAPKRKLMSKIDEAVLKYKQQNETMSKNLVYLTQSHFQGFDEATMNAMNKVVDTLYLLTIELNKSKDPQEMLSICQLYNSGFFEKAFEEKRKMMEAQGLSVPTGLVDTNGNRITSKEK